MALAAAPFGAPGLCSDWGIISLTTHSQHRTYSIKSLAPEAAPSMRRPGWPGLHPTHGPN